MVGVAKEGSTDEYLFWVVANAIPDPVKAVDRERSRPRLSQVVAFGRMQCAGDAVWARRADGAIRKHERFGKRECARAANCDFAFRDEWEVSEDLQVSGKLNLGEIARAPDREEIEIESPPASPRKMPWRLCGLVNPYQWLPWLKNPLRETVETARRKLKR